MKANAIIESGGRTFTSWDVSLAITQRLREDGTEPISFSLQCVPVRINEHGARETLDSAAVLFVRGREGEITDPREQAAFYAVQSAVVDFLRSKGL
jgi:hypothetical protein